MNDLTRQLVQDIAAMNKREISASARPSLQRRGLRRLSALEAKTQVEAGLRLMHRALARTAGFK
jgi:hypothetical protein